VIWLLWLGLGAALLLAYANSFQAGLVLDNKTIIGLDPRLRAWTAENLKHIFTQGYWWPTTISELYRPITTSSYLFNYAVLGNGDRVFGYHLVNFLLHWTNAWLVFVMVRFLSGRVRLAWIAAAIFGLHPVTVESVTNIVGRADLLATLSILSGGWCYIRSTLASGWLKTGWLVALGLTTGLGIFAKESAVMIAPCLLLYDWLWRWPKMGALPLAERWRVAAFEFGVKGYLALVPAFVIFFVARQRLPDMLSVVGQSFMDNPIAHAGVFQGFMTAIAVIGRYIGLLVFPHTLSCDYSFNQISLYGEAAHWWQDLYSWISLGVAAAIIWIAVRVRRKQPLATWGILWFFVMMLPTSNLLIPIGSIMAERFLYLPSVGFSVIAAFALRAAYRRMSSWRFDDGSSPIGAAWAIVLPVAVLAALTLRTIARNVDWKNELTLWESAVAASPASFKPHKGLSGAIWEASHSEAALDAAIARSNIGLGILERASLPIEQRDGTLFYQAGTFNRLKAGFVEKRGEKGEARRYSERAGELLLRAVEVDRWITDVRRKMIASRGGSTPVAGNYLIYSELALVHMQLGNWPQMRNSAAEVQKFAPTNPLGYSLAGAAEANAKFYDAAVVQLIAAFMLQPNDPEVRNNLAICYEGLGIRPSPVTVGAAGSDVKIDLANPVVRRQVNEAAAVLTETFESAGLHAAAATLRASIARQYEVPAASLQKRPADAAK
jgi:tetratricopeptide (TPR) repeat protein